MRVFKTRAFAGFAKKARLADAALCKAVQEAERGLIAADLGGGLIKQRIARPGQGKSGGFRTVLAFRRGHCAFFVYGFAKNERDNIGLREIFILREFAAELLGRSEKALIRGMAFGELVEVICEEEAIRE